jgi:hypothetical protein
LFLLLFLPLHEMKHRYQHPKGSQKMPRWRLTLLWVPFRREPQIDVTWHVFIPSSTPFLKTFFSPLSFSFSPNVSQGVSDGLARFFSLCVYTCLSRRFKYLCYIPQRSFLWPLIPHRDSLSSCRICFSLSPFRFIKLPSGSSEGGGRR